MSSTYFSRDYFTARERFRAAAAKVGWECKAHVFSSAGPQDKELTLDVAVSPADETERSKTLVLSSGLHGVEGFFGSAVQLAVLERIAAGELKLPVRCVMLHALNPFGFAWLRRTDHENVDNNRNFLLEDESFSGSPQLYALLDPLLNPQQRLGTWDFFRLRMGMMLAHYGKPALLQAIAAGQYEFPRGLFFGGKWPSETHRTLMRILPRLVVGSERVLHLDFHTGLGPRGSGKFLLDASLTPAQQQRLDEHFGRDAYEPCDAPQTSYITRGGLGRWAARQDLAPDYLLACVEYGTSPVVDMLLGLRAENQAWHVDGPSSPASTKAKARFKELFCPADEDWQSTVIASTLANVAKSLQYLQHHHD